MLYSRPTEESWLILSKSIDKKSAGNDVNDDISTHLPLKIFSRAQTVMRRMVKTGLNTEAANEILVFFVEG
jgi:hypothetical protein